MDSLNKGDIYSLCRDRAGAGNKPVGRQLLEIAWLYCKMGYGPAFYHEARFWRKHVTRSEMARYLIGPRYTRKVAQINNVEYYKASQNKLIEKAVLTLAGVPTPEFIGYFNPECGYNAAGAALCSTTDLVNLLGHQLNKRYCLKIVEGFGGASFHAFEVSAIDPAVTLRSLAGETEVLLTDFIEQTLVKGKLTQFLIEEYLHQHSTLSTLNPSSVNTLRLWVRQTKKSPRVVASLLRIGRAGSLTDNTTGGGLVAPVDLADGVIGHAYFMDGRHQYMQGHPDHGATIQGVSIPMWEQAKAIAIDAVKAFPGIYFAGLDIAIGEEGPAVIELNVEPEPLHATVVDVPTLDLLE